MWEQYETPDERRAKAVRAAPERPRPAQRPEPFRSSAIRSGGQTPGARAAIGIVAGLASLGIGLGIASSVESSSEPDYSGWYDCIAEESAGEQGLLSPADLCEIGHDRPPDYVDDDEYDPLDDSDSFGDGSYSSY